MCKLDNMKRFIGNFLKLISKNNHPFGKHLSKVIELLYLSVAFRFRIIKTSIYLFKVRCRKRNLHLNLTSKHKIKFPDIGTPITVPSIVSDGVNIKGAARISNGNYEALADFAGRPIQLYKNRGEALMNGIVLFKVNIQGEISEFTIRHSLSSIPNYEDPKICVHQNQTFLIMTNITSPIKNELGPWRSRIAVENLETGVIHQLLSPTNRGIEKNWIPIQSNGHLRLLYSSNPVSLISFEPSSGAAHFNATNYKSSIILNNRTQMIKTPHPSIPFIRIGSKKFAHRKFGYTPFHYFEILSDNFEPIKMSRPFVFSSIQMEMCQGLTIKGTTLIMSWTENDKDNMIGSIEIESVLKLFKQF
jgi:hypothetical protein